MEAIKKVLNPGQHKDDDIMYGQGGSSTAAEKDTGSGSFNAGVPSGSSDSPNLYTLPQEEKKSHGILRQILNPGGEKYSDVAYGATATTDASAPGVVEHSSAGEEKPKEHGILRQILNPGNDKYEPENFQGGEDALAPSLKQGEPIPGALATGSDAQPVKSTEAADDNRGILRQIINPGGQKYDEMRFEPTANVVSGNETSVTSTGTAAQESHGARDAASGAGLGAASYDAPTQHHLSADYDKNTQTGLLGTTAGASSGLASTTGGSASAVTSQTSTAPSQPGLTSTSDKSASGSHGDVLAAAGAGAAGGVASAAHNSGNDQDATLSHHVYNGVVAPPPTTSGHVHEYGATKTHIVSVTDGIPPPEPVPRPHGPSFDVPSAEEEPGSSAKVYNTVTGKHSGHELEGSQPEPASSASAAGLATGTALVGASTTLPEYSTATQWVPATTSATSNDTQATSAPPSSSLASSTQQSAIGVTGGTAAAAIAAQEAARRHQTQNAGFAASPSGASEKQLDSGPASKTIGPHDSNIANILDPRVKPEPELQKATGGDATGPASSTIGPHSSNIANVLDPRVKPEPELQKSSTTTGPHSSDLANKLDPRVKSDEQSTKTGQEALLGAGAGAAIGAGAYGAEQHRAAPTSTTSTAHTTEAAPTSSTGSAPLSAIDAAIQEGHQVDEKHRGPHVREDEHGHNKLHKEEKKEGFLHKLLHPHKKDHGHEGEVAGAQGTSDVTPSNSGAATEPHTGLPIDAAKYGSGAGGTDASEQIAGHQESSTARPADYDDIAKKNTIY